MHKVAFRFPGRINPFFHDAWQQKRDEPMSRLRVHKLKYLVVIVLAGAAVGLFAMLGPPRLLAKSEMPDFCASCHVMESQYEAWFQRGRTAE